MTERGQKSANDVLKQVKPQCKYTIVYILHARIRDDQPLITRIAFWQNILSTIIGAKVFIA